MNPLLVTSARVRRHGRAKTLAVTSSIAAAAVPHAIVVETIDADDAVAVVEDWTSKDFAGVLSPVLPFRIRAARRRGIGRQRAGG